MGWFDQIDENDPYAGSDSYYNQGSLNIGNEFVPPEPQAPQAPPESPYGPDYQWTGSGWVYAPKAPPTQQAPGEPPTAAATAPAQAANPASIQDFIANWQRTHAASEGIGPLADALVAAGYPVSRYMYGSVPSNNELSINGQKYKVLGGENGANPFWYTGGEEGAPDNGSGNTASIAQLSSYVPQSYTAPQPYTPTPYTPPAPFSYESFKGPDPFQGPTAQSVVDDPAFQLRLSEGRKALERSASAKGTLLTTGTLKNLTDFSQDLASTEFGNAFNRDLTKWNANASNALNTYNANRNNAFENYSTNAGIGLGAAQLNTGNAQNAYTANSGSSLAAFNANLASQGLGLTAQNQAYNQDRTTGLDSYGKEQDYINNLFRYTTTGQTSSGVAAPYVPSYLQNLYGNS